MTNHTEIEDKYAVGAEARLPDLGVLPGVASVAAPMEQHLVATYFDTPGLRLTAAHTTLRRRTGGDDAGWHLKLPTAHGRYEVHAPLGRSTRTVPRRLREVLALLLAGAELSPIARITTRRTAYRLLDEQGRILAEVADDRVETVAWNDEDAPVSRSWREWEVELVDGRPSLLRAAAELFATCAVSPAQSASKLAQALGDRVPESPVVCLPRERSAPPEEVVRAWLGEQVASVRRHDPLVRADAPDAVHEMRVATRRLRSALVTFRPLMRREVTDALREELAWIAGLLGAARDAEVLRGRLTAMLAAEDAAVVTGSAAARVDRTLRDRYARAHTRCVQAMTSERYVALLDRLDALMDQRAWAEDAHERSPAVLVDRVRHDWKRLERRVEAVEGTEGDDRAHRLHEVRKAAKRVRYAAEPLVPQHGTAAERFVKAATRVQSVLGDHQDSVIAQQELRRLADEAVADGDDSFTFGVLHAREDDDQAAIEERAWTAWATLSKNKRVDWLG
ncbi:MAG: CYTH and CHAD domain-containing protein [Nocardioidaceae bacterium]